MLETITTALLQFIVYIVFTLFIVWLIAMWCLIFIGLPSALLALVIFGLGYGVYAITKKRVKGRSN